MRASIRRFHSPDAELDSFSPDDSDNVGVLVQIMVGPSDQDGEESFDVVVCTPTWLEEWVKHHGPTIGRHYLVVPQWDWSAIQQYLVQQVKDVEGESWPDLASKLGRIAKWEFEDYEP